MRRERIEAVEHVKSREFRSHQQRRPRHKKTQISLWISADLAISIARLAGNTSTDILNRFPFNQVLHELPNRRLSSCRVHWICRLHDTNLCACQCVEVKLEKINFIQTMSCIKASIKQ